MSWTTPTYYESRPLSRSPPSSTQSRPTTSRFNQSSPSPYAIQDDRDRSEGSVAGNRSQRTDGTMQEPTRRRTSGPIRDQLQEPQQESTAAKDTRDPATKQVDQIVQHFFSKTVAVIAQTRTSQASNVGDFSDLPISSSPTIGAAPSLRRGQSATSSSGGKRKGEKMNSWVSSSPCFATTRSLDHEN